MSKFALTILIAVTVCVSPALAGVTIDVIPGFGPDPESPNYLGFVNNAIDELVVPGSSGVHRASDPTGWLPVPSHRIRYQEGFSSHWNHDLSFHS